MTKPSKGAMRAAHLAFQHVPKMPHWVQQALQNSEAPAEAYGACVMLAHTIDRETNGPLMLEALRKIAAMGIPTALDASNQLDCARVYGEEKAAGIARTAIRAVENGDSQ